MSVYTSFTRWVTNIILPFIMRPPSPSQGQARVEQDNISPPSLLILQVTPLHQCSGNIGVSANSYALLLPYFFC